MPLDQAIALQPQWVQVWLYLLIFGIVVLPLALLVWRQSRVAAVVTVLLAVLAGVGVSWIYNRLGYVKLLGLPHIILWTPLVIYLVGQSRRADMPLWPRRIILVVLAVLVASLAFDYVDAFRYFRGERAATVGTTG